VKRANVILFLFVGVPVIIYLVNPFGTATLDPRARIFGHVPYRIPSDSMHPTLQKNDFVLTSAMDYMDREPEINDIIVFKWPVDRDVEYVKRLVAKGGDTLHITQGQVYVNGVAIEQDYVDENNLVRSKETDMEPVRIPPEMLFVLGDNRDRSNGSRYWGFVPAKDVIGKVTRIWMSDDSERIGVVE